MNRRLFMVNFGLFGLSLITLGACGGNSSNSNSSEDTSEASNCAEESLSTSIASNHGHSLVIPAQDLNSNESKIYNIQGTSNHNHTLTITTSQFANLLDGTTLQITSTSGSGHSHIVSVSCG